MASPNDDSSPAYASFVLRDRTYVFGLLVAGVGFALALVATARTGNAASVLVVLALLGVAAYLFHASSRRAYRRRDVVEKRFGDIETEMLTTQFVLRNNVNLSGSVRRIRHIRNHPDIMELVGRLQRYETFDAGAFASAVSILERFFRYYEAIMLGKAPCDNLMRHMTDLRAELMNQMSFLESFNVRQKDMADVRKIGIALQAKTRRYMKIVSRKCDAAATGLYTFLDGVDCANARDPGASSHELY